MPLINFLQTVLIICLAVIYSAKNAAGRTLGQNMTYDISSEKLSQGSDCPLLYNITDVVYLGNASIFIQSENRTYNSLNYFVKNNTLYICNVSKKGKSLEDCEKIRYDRNEYIKYPNGSVLVYSDLLEPGAYEILGDKLITCWPDDDSDEIHNDTPSIEENASIYIGKIGSAVSILALIAHLIIFCLVPKLRNLPGYNLASLSVSFLFGYSFVLIGQIPKVVDVPCIISAVFQQYFFLSAFFCMNVMAFDVWRTLRLATKKLTACSNNLKMKKYLWYSLYAWGVPLVIIIISVVIDNIDGKFDFIKPDYGKDDVCWMTNNTAKTVFFIAPAFTLFVINGIFFVGSSLMIRNNKMKNTNDQQNQAVKMNHILYVKLGIMMGITWLIGVIATISQNGVVWFINDFFNSLQGLFLFLLFTCSRRVINHLRTKVSLKVPSSVRLSTVSSKVESQ